MLEHGTEATRQPTPSPGSQSSHHDPEQRGLADGRRPPLQRDLRGYGDRVVFDWPNVGSVLTFTFSVDDKGNLALRPIGPMDAGDQFVWSTKVWTKIR